VIVKSLHVRNFRSIVDETVPCERLTVLVGPNGSGKSSFLRALELFFSGSPKVTAEDFYAEDTSISIEIEVTFTALADEEAARFSSYLEGRSLTVVRVFSLTDGKISAKYHGSSLQAEDFRSIREASGAAAKKAAYEAIKNNDPKYADLAAWRNQQDALAALKQWEADHAGDCVRGQDDGQVLGFTEVAQGNLGRYTRFIPLPAVRDAADDAADERGSPITQIMDLVVRSALASREDLQTLKDETNKKYKEIVDPNRLDELRNLEGVLTGTLKAYVPDAAVSLRWVDGGGFEIPLPRADVRLVEDSYTCAVVRTGHGLQRAFILTMLQYLAFARKAVEQKPGEASVGQTQGANEAAKSVEPSLILVIEEPELYQHPNRQRHLAKVLRQLADAGIPGVSGSVQVIYATHSPFFVGIDRIDQLRLLRKTAGNEGKPKITRVFRTTLDQVAESLWDAQGRPDTKFTGESLRPRLQTVMTPWANEGFFADVAVLVEGEEDRAAILGTAAWMGHDLESEGVSVIPCMGKNNLDRPAVIFQKLGIATYVIWDNDQDAGEPKPQGNRYLLRLLGHPEEDWPTQVSGSFACFRNKLHTTLSQEIGSELFSRLMQEAQDDFGISRKEQALKNPAIIARVIKQAKAEDKSSGTIERIVERILALKPQRQEK